VVIPIVIGNGHWRVSQVSQLSPRPVQPANYGSIGGGNWRVPGDHWRAPPEGTTPVYWTGKWRPREDDVVVPGSFGDANLRVSRGLLTVTPASQSR